LIGHRLLTPWLAWDPSSRTVAGSARGGESAAEGIVDLSRFPGNVILKEHHMGQLDVSEDQLKALMAEVARLALSHWQSLEERASYPQTSGPDTEMLFKRDWPEEGLGGAVFDGFPAIADRSRPSTGRFFGYVFGSGEPIGAMSELLIAALNQNTTGVKAFCSFEDGVIRVQAVGPIAVGACDGTFPALNQ